MQLAREQLGLTWRYIETLEVEAQKMINQSLAEAAFRPLCDDIWRPKDDASTSSTTIAANRSQSLTRLFVAAVTNASIRGTNYPATWHHRVSRSRGTGERHKQQRERDQPRCARSTARS